MARKAKSGSSVLDQIAAGQIAIASSDGAGERPRLVAEEPRNAETAGSEPAGSEPAGNTAADAAGEFDRTGLDPADAFGSDPFKPGDTAGGNSFTNTGSAGADRQRERDGRSSPEANAKRAATRARNKEAAGGVSLSETLLLGIHSTLATVAKNPDLEITQEEARKLSEAIGEVQKHYGFSIDPKTQAWLHLMGVAGQIYAPKVMAEMFRRDMRRRATMTDEQPQEAVLPTAPPGAPIPPRPPASVDPKIRVVKDPKITNPSQFYPPGMRGG